MIGPSFVHLHCHSHYSLLDGANHVPRLVKRVQELGMPAIALTDHGNLHGAAELLREAKAVGVVPIIGLEAYVAPGRRTDRTTGGASGQEHSFHLTLLAQTGEGVRNLMRLSSRSWLEGHYYKPRIDKEILERHSEGLICLSGCASSEFSDLLLHDKNEDAAKLCAWYERVFGPDRFFVEIQNNGVMIQKECEERALDLARRLGLPVVATSDAHYLTAEDADAHDILLCISMGKTVDDTKRMKFETKEFHVRSPSEMYAAMPGQDEALARSATIAASVEPFYPSLNFGRRCFPSFEPPGGATPEQYLRELCEAGLVDRYGDHAPPEARDRLEHELGIIIRMGFAPYFLIVWDFVRFARERGIPASARGSACGALVSYLLHISHVCPIHYDLLFERFLDPNRSEAPDIDIDLCKDRRYEVIEYVRRKYGEANVAQIGTFGELKAKAAIKDVGRVLNIPLSRVEAVNKLIPTRLNITLDEALKEEPQLRKLVSEDPEIERLIDFARRIEGTYRNVSTHAAGVVIADRPLEDLVPLQRIPNKDKSKEVVSTQWAMGDVEKAGLLKMDFLGLRNLTSLDDAVRRIERRTGKPFDLFALPLDDKPTYDLLQRGEALGVFQLDGSGIRDLLVKMKPDRFQDLIAILALYRPGPLNGGMVDDYVNRKHGREQATYEHPFMREILEETYGVMVYQEQVMRILNRLGGVELSQAYATIKAISKKKTEIIAKGREQFVAGAVASGLEKERASKIFELIEFFGGYGFNKSHTTAYALVAYQTAYLKAHYPTEFMAALLSSEMDGAEREKYFVDHVEDCRRRGIEVLPPDINAGGLAFEVAAEGRIHFGLGAIKGVGAKAVEAIVAARQAEGPFRSLDELFERVSTKELGQAAAETLVRAGAFDSLGARRAQLLAVLPRAILAGQSRQDDRKRGQRGLFDDMFADAGRDEPAAYTLPDVPELPDVELLAGEKKALGFYMSSHPLARHADTLAAFRTHQTTDIAGLPEKTEVTIGGMITGVVIRNVSKSRSGLTRMAKFTVEDLAGSTPAMLWPEEYAKLENLVREDSIGFIRGTIDRRRDPAELVVNRFIPLEQAATELARGIVLTLNKTTLEAADIERLQRVLRHRQGGPLELYLEIEGLDGFRRIILRAGPSWKVRHDDRLIVEIEAILGPQRARLLGPGGAVTRPSPVHPVAKARTDMANDDVEMDDSAD
jgi:DNA polymerase-3 subunit alpha